MTIIIIYILWDSTMKTIWNITEKRFLAPWEYDVKSASHSIMSDSLWPHGLYNPQNSQGQNTGVGSLSLLQGIFPTQGLNPGLPHCRQILYQLNHKGNPRILEWVAYPFFRGSSRSRNRTGVLCIAGGFFPDWAKTHWCTNQYNLKYLKTQINPRLCVTHCSFVGMKLSLDKF